MHVGTPEIHVVDDETATVVTTVENNQATTVVITAENATARAIADIVRLLPLVRVMSVVIPEMLINMSLTVKNMLCKKKSVVRLFRSQRVIVILLMTPCLVTVGSCHQIA